MAKAVKKKVAKKRAKVYDEKLTINGTFEDVIALSVYRNDKPATATGNVGNKKSKKILNQLGLTDFLCFDC